MHISGIYENFFLRQEILKEHNTFFFGGKMLPSSCVIVTYRFFRMVERDKYQQHLQ
jgi:hypothetical protein